MGNSNTIDEARITVIIRSMITCCPNKKGKMDSKKPFDTWEYKKFNKNYYILEAQEFLYDS